MSSKSKPLPLHATLRDLALLRASGVDLSTLFPEQPSAADTAESAQLSNSTQQSYEFVNEARGALRVYNNGELQRKREEIQHVQGELDQILKGLS